MWGVGEAWAVGVGGDWCRSLRWRKRVRLRKEGKGGEGREGAEF